MSKNSRGFEVFLETTDLDKSTVTVVESSSNKELGLRVISKPANENLEYSTLHINKAMAKELIKALDLFINVKTEE